MTAISTELPVTLPNATGSGKSKMVTSKLQIRISHLVHKIATSPLTNHRLLYSSSLAKLLVMCGFSAEAVKTLAYKYNIIIVTNTIITGSVLGLEKIVDGLIHKQTHRCVQK